MQVEIILDPEDGGVGQRGLVDVEECIVDCDERQDDEVDFADELLLFHGVDWFVELVGIGEELEGHVAVILLVFGGELELVRRGWETHAFNLILGRDALVVRDGVHGFFLESAKRIQETLAQMQSRLLLLQGSLLLFANTSEWPVLVFVDYIE